MACPAVRWSNTHIHNLKECFLCNKMNDYLLKLYLACVGHLRHSPLGMECDTDRARRNEKKWERARWREPKNSWQKSHIMNINWTLNHNINQRSNFMLRSMRFWAVTHTERCKASERECINACNVCNENQQKREQSLQMRYNRRKMKKITCLRVRAMCLHFKTLKCVQLKQINDCVHMITPWGAHTHMYKCDTSSIWYGNNSISSEWHHKTALNGEHCIKFRPSNLSVVRLYMIDKCDSVRLHFGWFVLSNPKSTGNKETPI